MDRHGPMGLWLMTVISWQPLQPPFSAKYDVPKDPTAAPRSMPQGPCRAKCAGKMGMCLPGAL